MDKLHDIFAGQIRAKNFLKKKKDVDTFFSLNLFNFYNDRSAVSQNGAFPEKISKPPIEDMNGKFQGSMSIFEGKTWISRGV